MAEETKELDAALVEIYNAYVVGDEAQRAAILGALQPVQDLVRELDVDTPQPSSVRIGIKPGTLKLNAEFRRVAADNQWAERDPSVWGKSLSKIVNFLKETYEPWLGNGMVQADLLAVDRKAYFALQTYLSRNQLPLPEDLPLPSLADARLAAADPVEKAQLLAIREYDRNRKSLGNFTETSAVVGESVPEQG